MSCGGMSEQNKMVGFKNGVSRFARLPGIVVVSSVPSPRAARRSRLSCQSTALVGIHFQLVPVDVRVGTDVHVGGALQRAATRPRARLTTRCSRRGPRSRSDDGNRRGVARAAERER